MAESQEPGGWLRVDLRPDPSHESLMNAANFSGARGMLVLRLPCDVDVSGLAPSPPACASGASPAPPRVRTHIWATGVYSRNLDTGWMEINPVFDWRPQ